MAVGEYGTGASKLRNRFQDPWCEQNLSVSDMANSESITEWIKGEATNFDRWGDPSNTPLDPTEGTSPGAT